MSYTFFSALLLIPTLFSVGDAQIRCFVCQTGSGLYADKCGDDFRLTSVDALYCQGSCQKTRGIRSEGSRQVVEITRGCVPYTSNEGCWKGTYLGIEADICVCSSELCNSASSNTYIWTLLAAVVLLLIMRSINLWSFLASLAVQGCWLHWWLSGDWSGLNGTDHESVFSGVLKCLHVVC